MSVVPISHKFTPEDLLRMPLSQGVELVDGQLLEKPVSEESNFVSGQLFGRLYACCMSSGDFWAFPPDTGFQCFPQLPNQIRKPDAAVIRRERLPRPGRTGFVRIVPDLIAEVVSPTDDADSLDAKLQEYQDAGVRLIWTVFPLGRSVWVMRADGSAARLREDQILSGEDVLPGFQCRVGDLFLPPPLETADATASA